MKNATDQTVTSSVRSWKAVQQLRWGGKEGICRVERETSRRDVSQSVVVRRYQKRALKSSLQVMKPGLVGEWTMQRTMLL